MALARIAVAIAPNGDGKLARSVRARRGLVQRIESKAQAVRDRSRPLVWFHAPSVGEGLQAKAIIEALRAVRPDVQIAYTFFSPSAERFAASLSVDLADYLPFDGVREADAMLDALAPSLLVFVKLDVWPELVSRAKARGIRVALLSATLAAQSGRRGFFARAVLSDAYAALDAVGAIDRADIERLVKLGVRSQVSTVAGDTRFDQVAARAEGSREKTELLARFRSTRPTLVAGSTWPADEHVLFDAWQRVRDAIPEARLVIAPHEPTATHVASIESTTANLKLRTLRSSSRGTRNADFANTECDVLIVDEMGILGDVYAVADVAFVGGGFHRAGLHSVLEPAAFGAPVLFGTLHHNSREAGLLLQRGAGRAAHNASELAAHVVEWFSNAAMRSRDGATARAVVLEGCGAAEKSTALIIALLSAGATSS